MKQVYIRLCMFLRRISIQPWFKRRKAAKAEEFANIIYEQRKRRALQQNED